MKTRISNLLVIAMITFSAAVLSCKKEELIAPPTIDLAVSVNNVAYTLLNSKGIDSVVCDLRNKVDYLFQINSNAPIADLKTVFYNYANPLKPLATETLVGGLPQGLNQTVTGVVYPAIDLRIKLVVTDKGGNEVSKIFIVNVLP